MFQEQTHETDAVFHKRVESLLLMIRTAQVLIERGIPVPALSERELTENLPGWENRPIDVSEAIEEEAQVTAILIEAQNALAAGEMPEFAVARFNKIDPLWAERDYSPRFVA